MRGGVEDFIAFVQQGLPRFQRTMHFIGNVLIEPVGDLARVESYIVAHHHLAESRTKPERDYTVGLRYVDDFERRDGTWRIARRVSTTEMSWVDDEVGRWDFPDHFTTGHRDRTDAVYAPWIGAGGG